MGRGFIASLLALVVLAVSASVALAFDPATEAQNFGKGNERSAIYNTPEYRQLLTQVSVDNRLEAMGMQAADPERNFLAQLCATGEDGCAGDVRLYDWQGEGCRSREEGPVHCAQRRDALGTRLGDARRPEEAPRHRDHERLRAGAGAGLLVRRADA